MTSDRHFPTCEEVREALSAKLASCREAGVKIDSITFSGNGEPTLNPEFPEIAGVTAELRDRYYPEAKISVLSNATTLLRPRVLEAMKKVDNPILKIDAPDDDGVMKINRPAGRYSLSDVVSALQSFDGNFILQTMFLKSPDYDSSSQCNLGRWMDIVRKLHPREVMVYTIDRETPQKNLVKFSAADMEEMVRPLLDEGFRIQIRG